MENEPLGNATYSPEDNKLRFYPFARLTAEDYARAKAHGFSWAPRQELFVAPMWTPARVDLLVEWCGEIGDEDKSLVKRSEERADRFEDYSEKRADDAEQARCGVAAIADNIPLGQPILIGHHSEKHARKDAERIENGMRRAVKMWETSAYWTQRAAGAIRAAKYKELPAVRARRIKGLEADQRKTLKSRDGSKDALARWSKPDLTHERAVQLANFCGFSMPRKDTDRPDFQQQPSAYDALLNTYPNLYGPRTLEEVIASAIRCYSRSLDHAERWLVHYANRLAYERAMLAESGGTVADQTKPETGGACRAWCSPRGGWSIIQKANRVSVSLLDNWGNGGRNFKRIIPFDKLTSVMTRAQVEEMRAAGNLIEDPEQLGFFIKSGTERPATTDDAVTAAPVVDTAKAETDAMRETLRAGVKVVVAPQLFPTPAELAQRMVELADIRAAHRVLEPSAGTGAILRLLGNQCDKVAVEINPALIWGLTHLGLSGLCVHEADFLQCNGNLGKFDRILMNPPFVHGADIAHIKHALHMLKPGGRLVAICAGGPRQEAALQPLADSWEQLPPDTFKDQGTSVRTVLLTITA